MPSLLVLLLLQARWLLPPSGVVALDGPWRFLAGDTAAYASPAFADSAWTMVVVPDAWNDRDGVRPHGYAWYRGRIVFDRAQGREIGLQVRAAGMAVEVYVDGEALGRIGGFPPDYGPRTDVRATSRCRSPPSRRAPTSSPCGCTRSKPGRSPSARSSWSR